ncbi:MAG: pyridoxal 5'-phosphate synthase glutaminase subunit PdxT [Candidatus Micrarchaeia archaeon]
MKIGVLALQGNVIEHKNSLADAAAKLKLKVEIVEVRKAEQLAGLSGIILPGGESTAHSLLLQKYELLEEMKKIPFVFGTCAGLILIAKEVKGLEKGQKTLELMDVFVSRNAYGSQLNSFMGELEGKILDKENVLFIRAPKILKVGAGVKVLAKVKETGDIAIIEQEKKEQYLLGATCHPEMTGSKLTQYFLEKISKKK